MHIWATFFGQNDDFGSERDLDPITTRTKGAGEFSSPNEPKVTLAKQRERGEMSEKGRNLCVSSLRYHGTRDMRGWNDLSIAKNEDLFD